MCVYGALAGHAFQVLFPRILGMKKEHTRFFGFRLNCLLEITKEINKLISVFYFLSARLFISQMCITCKDRTTAKAVRQSQQSVVPCQFSYIQYQGMKFPTLAPSSEDSGDVLQCG